MIVNNQAIAIIHRHLCFLFDEHVRNLQRSLFALYMVVLYHMV